MGLASRLPTSAGPAVVVWVGDGQVSGSPSQQDSFQPQAGQSHRLRVGSKPVPHAAQQITESSPPKAGSEAVGTLAPPGERSAIRGRQRSVTSRVVWKVPRPPVVVVLGSW
jgi:hypothetical protein